MNQLLKILHRRRLGVEESKKERPLASLEKIVRAQELPRGFAASIRRRRAVIAEFKRASPSRGVIAEHRKPEVMASLFAEHGARALSVLTEPEFFRGSADDLVKARGAAGLPVLRKDFIVDEYQVYESRAMGADAVLLITAALEVARFRELRSLVERLGMDALVEVHEPGELEFALAEGCPLIGINNRDLSTLEVRVDHALSMFPLLPERRPCVIVESGLTDMESVVRYHAAGADGFLIGEWLMTAASPGERLAGLVRALERAP